MTVNRHSLPLPLARFPLPGGVEVQKWCGTPADRGRVTRLAEACREAAGAAGGPAIRDAGLLGELQSRPGRRVEAWLATAEGDPSPPGGCLGLVTLVEATSGWSIGWLLVHPAERRRGLARGLVSIAAAAAGGRGAEAISAETLSHWPAASAFWQGLAPGGTNPGLG